MDRSDELLVSQLKESLAGGAYKTAFQDDATGDDAGEQEQAEQDNPLGTDFFKAINAYRAARTSGDAKAMSEAERHLQDVVRGELLGNRCEA